MATNPYRPTYTDSQRRRVESARRALLERWNASKTLRDGQPAGFAVTHEEEALDGDRLVDVFRASPASPRFSDAWKRELHEHDTTMSVEHSTRAFRVMVAHSHYLSTSLWHAMVPDAQCMSSSAVQLLVAAALVYVAFTLA